MQHLEVDMRQYMNKHQSSPPDTSWFYVHYQRTKEVASTVSQTFIHSYTPATLLNQYNNKN